MMAVATQTMAAGVAAPRVPETTERVRERPDALPALTGLRLVAALLVVLGHATTVWRSGLVPPQVPLLGALAQGSSYAGLDVFFVLSGFILVYTYLRPDGTRRAGARAFWWARVARIAPLYLCGLALGVGPYLWTALPGAPPLATALAALTMTQAWFPHLAMALDGPAWSLSVEAFFYLLFPLLVRPLARAGAGTLALLALGAYGASLGLSSAALLLGARGIGGSDLMALASLAPLVRLPEFVVGLALGRLFLLRRAVQRERRAEGAPRRAGVRAVLGLVCLGLGCLVTRALPDPLRHSAALLPGAGLLIYALAGGHGALAWLLGRPSVLRLGEASYALYLLHYPLFAWLTRAGLVPAGRGPAYVAFLVPFGVLLLACAVLAWRTIEVPARRALRAAPPACVRPRPLLGQQSTQQQAR